VEREPRNNRIRNVDSYDLLDEIEWRETTKPQSRSQTASRQATNGQSVRRPTANSASQATRPVQRTSERQTERPVQRTSAEQRQATRPVARSERQTERPAQRTSAGQATRPVARPERQTERPVQRASAGQRQTERPVQRKSAEQRQATRPTQRPATKVTEATTATKKKPNKKRQKDKKFKKRFLIAWLAFVGVLVAALVVLFCFLTAFEKSRPNKVIQNIVKDIENKNVDYLHFVTEDGLSIDNGDIIADKNDIADILIEKSEGASDSKGISFRILNAESTDENKVYLIKADDTKAMKIVLKKSDKKLSFGFYEWTEKETKLMSDLYKVTDVVAQIPQDCTLQVNGKNIGREKITAEGERISLLTRLMDQGFIGEQPRVDTYTVKGIFADKNVKLIDASGNSKDCVYTGNVYSGGFDASDEFVASQIDRVIAMFEPYALYFSGERGQWALSEVMVEGSPAYVNATSVDVSWMQEHSGVDITEKKAENFKYYSDQVYSCDISFVQTIYQGDTPVKTWDTNMTWVMIWSGDNYYLADFVTKAAED